MPDLLLCPHCGSSAAFHQLAEPDSDNDGGYYIECANPLCGMTTTLMFACGDDPKPLLAERWNRRVTPASDGGVSRVVAAAIAYRQAETDGTPRMWRGKALQDLANTLDEAIASYIEEHARPAPSDAAKPAPDLLRWRRAFKGMPNLDEAQSEPVGSLSAELAELRAIPGWDGRTDIPEPSDDTPTRDELGDQSS